MSKVKKMVLNEKKETILVWLDFGPYSYINLGIIKELKELKEFDFIGIVTTHQDLSFFQKQKFISFKKLFYYPDCYIGKTDFNINKIKMIEESLDLDLWKDIFSERSFYKFWIDFHQFTREEILVIIEKSLTFFIDIINEYQPKKLLMQQPGENVSNLLLYRIAKKMNIETFLPINLHLKNRIYISNNLTSKEISDEFNKLKEESKNELEKYDEKYLEKNEHTETLKIVSNFDSSIPTFSKKINYYLKRMSLEREPTYNNLGKTKLKLLKNRIKNYFTIKKRTKFLDVNAIKIIKSEKFFYFPLQSEPEATILALSPFFSNQISLIETIAKAIPIDSVLYVKEHPIQKEKLWRHVEDYKKIISIPNVKLIHPSINSLKLVQMSEGIISISGTTGFEGLFYKKPVIIFGDEHYEKLSMVTKIQKINNLSTEIKNAITNFKFNQNELNLFMVILNKLSLAVPYASMMKDGVSLSSIQRNGENFDVTNSHFENFIGKYSDSFTLIAKAILSKSIE
jgi:hypothetical protein